MFSWLKKDPIKKLQKEYEKKMAEAVEYQRKGDIETYSKLSSEIDKILKQIDKLRETKIK